MKTQKELAEQFGMSEKTYREYREFGGAVRRIESKVSAGLMKAFTDYEGKYAGDKKSGLSMKQITAISYLPQEEITEVLTDITTHPERAREIYAARNLSGNVKVTVTLSARTNEHFKEEARKHGISKTEYLAKLLELIATADEQEEQ